MVTDAQVNKLMKELKKHGRLGLAADRAGMDRGTARRWRDRDLLPSETRTPRTYRTREDPFSEDWPVLRAMLEDAPELEAKTLFEWLNDDKPGRYQEGQLRTLQRRVKRWRAQHGPDKQVFFPQVHRPGEAAQTDFTHGTALDVTLAGESFPHLIGHFALPYSNWEWPTVCRSESHAAIARTVQDGLFVLGRVPEWHQTDNSTAATHDVLGGRRGFNKRYAELMAHLGMKPRTTAVGAKEQNGDIEALNGAFKRRVHQYLLLRGSRDFDSADAYESFLRSVASRANRTRQTRVDEELAVMRPLVAKRVPVFDIVDCTVTSWATIRVKHNAYSVPSRLIGERVRVRLYEDRLEVFHADTLQLIAPRLLGRFGHRIDFRHVIWSLVRKPGAFARYRYREDMFPSLVFRAAYDAITQGGPCRRTDLAYLRLLHLAASTSVDEVETAVSLLLQAREKPTVDAVREVLEPPRRAVPHLDVGPPDLHAYDTLLAGVSR